MVSGFTRYGRYASRFLSVVHTPALPSRIFPISFNRATMNSRCWLITSCGPPKQIATPADRVWGANPLQPHCGQPRRCRGFRPIPADGGWGTGFSKELEDFEHPLRRFNSSLHGAAFPLKYWRRASRGLFVGRGGGPDPRTRITLVDRGSQAEMLSFVESENRRYIFIVKLRALGQGTISCDL
jgi:hypothetical protein